MRHIYIVFLGFLVISSFSQNKTYEELKTEKRNLQSQISLLQSQLKAVNSEMEKLKNGTANVVFEGSGNNRIEANAGNGGAVLRDKASSIGGIVSTIKAGEAVLLYKEKNGLYIKAAYNGQLGWVSYTSLKVNTELDNFMTKKTTSENTTTTTTTTTTISSVDTNSPRYKRISKLYGHEKAVKIINKQLWKGMSHGMLVESLGQPSERKSVNTPEGLKEDWKYSDRTVVFLNGELKSWE